MVRGLCSSLLLTVCALSLAACGVEVQASLPARAPAWQEVTVDDWNDLFLGKGDQDHLFQCWSESGSTIVKSEALNTHSLPRLAQGAAEARFEWTTLADGRRVRAAAMRLRPVLPDEEHARGRGLFPYDPAQESEILEVVVVRDVSDLETTLSRLRLLMLLTWVTLSVGCAGILSWVVHRSLRPVESLRRQIEGMDEETLRQRLEVADAPSELQPVVGQLNKLLDRMQAAFEREHAFTSDAAHELRTPIAGLRSTLEVALIRPRTPDEYKKTAERCLAITGEMQDVVETLLDLAKLEALVPERSLEHGIVSDLARECWEPFAGIASERHVALAMDVDPELVVTTELRLLRRVLGNLFENAVTYTGEGSTVSMDAALRGSDVVFTISNPVTGAHPELAENAFEAFWRADSARTAAGRHAGLGLALCKRIVEVLGGHVHASVQGADEGSVFTVHVTLPRSREAA